MKKLLIIGLVLMTITSAQAQLSTIRLSSFNQMPVNIKVDGQLVAKNANSVVLNQIPAGLHTIQVVPFGYANNPHVYGPKPMNVLFYGTIEISSNTYMEALVYPNQLQIVQQYALAPAPPANVVYGNNMNCNNNGYNGYGQNCGNNNGYGHNNNGNYHHPNNGNHYGNNNCQPQNGNYGNYGNNANNGYGYGGYYMPQAMDNGSFNQLKQSIDNQWFSSGKLDVFNQALAQNYFTAQQVSELLPLYSFDSDKLSVAKSAYNKTIDPQNYFMVNSQFGFSSSVNDLTAYIASL